MKTVVTGGAGFIGSTLVDRLLAEGHEVEVLDNLATGSLANLAEARADRSHRLGYHQLDVCDPQVVDVIARRAPEVIFHLAGQPDDRLSVARPVLDVETNLVGALNVLEGARVAGTRKVVFASSGSVYGEVPTRDLPVRESHPGAPVSPAAVTKRAVHDHLNVYRRVHGLEFTALALANIYGPRQDPRATGGVVAIFAAALAVGGACTIYGDGEQTRDFLYVDDCVDAIVRSADRGDGLLINVGTGVETTINALYATMAAAAGGAARPARAAAARPGEPARAALDPGRAAIQLGWRPWTELAEGVARVADWVTYQAG